MRQLLPDWVGLLTYFANKVKEDPFAYRYYENKVSEVEDTTEKLILFILMQSDNDIILIDQPEDDLDNKIIYDEVITAIAKKKQDIQFSASELLMEQFPSSR